MPGIRDLAPIILVVGVAGLILAFVLLIAADVGEEIAVHQGAASLAACVTEACNATKSLITALGNFADWFALIVLVAVMSIVLGLLIMAFAGSGRIK